MNNCLVDVDVQISNPGSIIEFFDYIIHELLINMILFNYILLK